MENQINNQPPVKPLVKKILWFAFLGAIFIYSIVAVIISKFVEEFEEGVGFVGLDDGTLSILFYAFLFLSMIQLVVLFKWNSKVEHKSIESLPENKKDLFTVKYSLATAMAVYGFTLFLMNGNFDHLILFSGLAVVGMLLSYPKKNHE